MLTIDVKIDPASMKKYVEDYVAKECLKTIKVTVDYYTGKELRLYIEHEVKAAMKSEKFVANLQAIVGAQVVDRLGKKIAKEKT
jgi:hypothetical protein